MNDSVLVDQLNCFVGSAIIVAAYICGMEGEGEREGGSQFFESF